MLDHECSECLWYDVCDHEDLCEYFSPAVDEWEPASTVLDLPAEEAEQYWGEEIDN